MFHCEITLVVVVVGLWLWWEGEPPPPPPPTAVLGLLATARSIACHPITNVFSLAKSMSKDWDNLSLDEDVIAASVVIGKVDVTQNDVLGTRFDIEGFPTLVMLSKGKSYGYEG